MRGSLYLAPAHPAAMKPFVVIRQALLRADNWALGRTVFSSKRQLVIDIQEQPLTIWYQWREQGNTLHIQLLEAAPDVRPRKEANAGCSYIVPDLLVEMTSGQKRLVEVKPSDRLAKPLAQRKLSVARQFAATEDWAFHLVTLRQRRCRPKPRVSAAAKPRSATLGNEWPKSPRTPTGFHTRSMTGRANCETPLGFARW